MTWGRLNWQKVSLLLAALLVIGIRLRLQNIPLERDEGEFAYAGQLMLQGIPPYKLCYNMKAPGIYAAYAAVMAVFGQTPAGIRMGLLLVNLAAAALLYFLARRFLDETGATVSTIAFGLMTVSPRMLGLAAHATQFVAAAALGGLLVLCQAYERKAPARYFWGGFLMGVAFLMKQPGAMFGLFALTILLWLAVREGNWAQHARWIGLFALGGVVPVAVTMLLLKWAGVFDRFWFWTVTYARVHASVVPLSLGWALYKDYMLRLSDGWFWVAFVAGLLAFLILRQGDWGRKCLLLGLTAFSAVAVSASLYFTHHYFVLLAPAMALSMGAGVSEAMQRLANPWKWAPLLAFAAVCGVCLVQHGGLFFKSDPVFACRQLYSLQPFPECEELGRYLRERTKPGETIAVIGSEPEIYFYAHRHSASGYIYMYDLLEGGQPFSALMRHEMERQLEAAKPDILIHVTDYSSWAAWPVPSDADKQEMAQWIAKFLQNYQPWGMTIIGLTPQYWWGPGAFDHLQSNEPHIAIFRRNR